VQLLKNFPAFYGTQRFVTVFTRALHWSLSWARSIHSVPPHYVSLRFILILSTHLRLGLPGSLFPSGFPTIILYTFPLFALRATCPAHDIYIYKNSVCMKINVLEDVWFRRRLLAFRMMCCLLLHVNYCCTLKMEAEHSSVGKLLPEDTKSHSGGQLSSCQLPENLISHRLCVSLAWRFLQKRHISRAVHCLWNPEPTRSLACRNDVWYHILSFLELELNDV
jgi:hypothetical protein